MTEQFIKIAIPSIAPGGLDAQTRPYFGRCDCFTIVELQNALIKSVKVLENPFHNATGGAGPGAVTLLSNEGVQEVIGADYGPNASNALNMAKIGKFGYPSDKSYLVKEMITLYLGHKLPKR